MRVADFDFLTTARCDLDCPTCGQRALRRARPGYDLAIDQVVELLTRADALGVSFAAVCLGGGEPTLWPHFDVAVELLAAAGCVGEIRVLTNGRDPDAILRHADDLGRVMVTDYPAHRERVDRLVAEYPGRLARWAFDHRPPPAEPLAGTLPAACRCGKPCLYGRRIFDRAPSPDRLVRLGLDLGDPNQSVDLADDWPAWLQRREAGKYTRPICEICISNKRVWDRLSRH